VCKGEGGQRDKTTALILLEYIHNINNVLPCLCVAVLHSPYCLCVAVLRSLYCLCVAVLHSPYCLCVAVLRSPYTT